jgi:hypothetical protein
MSDITKIREWVDADEPEPEDGWDWPHPPVNVESLATGDLRAAILAKLGRPADDSCEVRLMESEIEGGWSEFTIETDYEIEVWSTRTASRRRSGAPLITAATPRWPRSWRGPPPPRLREEPTMAETASREEEIRADERRIFADYFDLRARECAEMPDQYPEVKALREMYLDVANMIRFNETAGGKRRTPDLRRQPMTAERVDADMEVVLVAHPAKCAHPGCPTNNGDDTFPPYCPPCSEAAGEWVRHDATHLADALAPLLAARERAAKAEALREYALSLSKYDPARTALLDRAASYTDQPAEGGGDRG